MLAAKNGMVSIEPCDDSAPDIEVRKRRKAFYRKNGYGSNDEELGYRKENINE